MTASVFAGSTAAGVGVGAGEVAGAGVATTAGVPAGAGAVPGGGSCLMLAKALSKAAAMD